MKLLSAAQIRQWDQYTMQHEPVSSINLMERAAQACTDWLIQYDSLKPFFIFCGKGNNGGDGLAIARLLCKNTRKASVFILDTPSKSSDDFNTNLERLKTVPAAEIVFLKEESGFPVIPEDALIVDALFGTGLSRRLEGIAEKLVQYINRQSNEIIAIDLPSGLLCDVSSKNFTVAEAAHTLTFQCLKQAFLMPENERFLGAVHILDIRLHPGFLNTVETRFALADTAFIHTIFQPRNAFSHKGNFGHALLVAGSYGKMGAAVLSTKACLRSGVGLVTAHIPHCGLDILQVSAPEAMCKADAGEKAISVIDYDLSVYSAAGIGPGIDKAPATAELLHQLVTVYKKPMVIDADALNMLSENQEWLGLLPENSILTPHPKEFARLFGAAADDFERIETALQKASELKVIIVLKGHHTFIAAPSGKGYFNTTGNAGMATGGSGDVLTGIITGLLARGYAPLHAAILGVYQHGLAGDKAAAKYGMDAMTAGDLVEAMGK